MFLRASQSNGHTYLRLVQNYRDEQGRTRQRQLAQLGRADLIGRETVESLITSLRKHTGMPELNEGGVHFNPARSLGATWLLTELWQELGFDEQLRRVFRSSYREFDAESLIRMLVFNRLCDPQSKLGAIRWLERVHLPGIDTSGVHHEQLLRNRSFWGVVDRIQGMSRSSLMTPAGTFHWR